ncbi:hypothetical protein [Halopelagius fulvigenes]|uniref:Uncharacterized protein n=1 Tax=Halopelagius fulvigenes TaxID=1198324 RepID=A0ABD5TU41_9EURY
MVNTAGTGADRDGAGAAASASRKRGGDGRLAATTAERRAEMDTLLRSDTLEPSMTPFESSWRWDR